MYLFQQVSVLKVVDAHGMAHLREGLCRLGAGLLAPHAQQLVHLRQTARPHLAALADGTQLLLHDAVEELLHRHIAEPAALIVRLQLVETAVLRQEGREVLGLAERVEVDEHGLSFVWPGSSRRRCVGSVNMDMTFWRISSGLSAR